MKYVQGVYHDLSSLADIVDENTSYYFSVPPEIYLDLLGEIAKFKFNAVGIEKPFGTSHSSFMKLACFKNHKIYFIDHYLLKPLMVVMPEIIKMNKKYVEILNKNNISYVEACFNESISAQGRVYFDRTGIIKDVMQNHLMVVLASIISLHDFSDSSDESVLRAKIIEKIKINNGQCIVGQYVGYTEELGTPSETETFASIGLRVETKEWEGVPFIITAGKALETKSTEVSFEIKKEAYEKFLDLLDANLRKKVDILQIKSMKMCFNFAPMNEVYLNIKNDEYEEKLILYDAETINKMMHKKYNNLRGHEIVFDSILNNRPFSHAGFDEISALWKLFDSSKTLFDKKDLFYYKKGVSLPKEGVEFKKKIINGHE